MLPDPDGDGVYSITLAIDSGEVQYKFRRYFNGSANWEGIGNRVYDAVADATPYMFQRYGGLQQCTRTVRCHLPRGHDQRSTRCFRCLCHWRLHCPSWQDGAIQLTPDPNNPGFYETTYNMCPGFYWKFVNGDPDRMCP